MLNPTGFTTLITLLPLLPPTRIVRAFAEAERVKLGTGMFTLIAAVLVRFPDVPVTVTV